MTLMQQNRPGTVELIERPSPDEVLTFAELKRLFEELQYPVPATLHIQHEL